MKRIEYKGPVASGDSVDDLSKQYQIEEFPEIKEGEHAYLGYLTGITIENDMDYVAEPSEPSDIRLYFDGRDGKRVFKTGGNVQLITEIMPWFETQLIERAAHDGMCVKLYAYKINGEIKFDLP